MTEELKNIATELESRLASAQRSIAEAAMAGELDKVQTIAAAANRLKDATAKIEALGKEIRRAISEFDNATRSHTKSPHTRLSVTIRWPLAGESIADETISEDTAAATITRFFESLVGVMGEKILITAKQVRVGSSGLVSQDPQQDFRNPNTNEVYGHQEIGKSGWFVKTNTSTVQKQEQIRQVAAKVGMPREALDVSIVEK